MEDQQIIFYLLLITTISILVCFIIDLYNLICVPYQEN